MIVPRRIYQRRSVFFGLHVPRFPLKDSRFPAPVYHCSSRVPWWEATLVLLGSRQEKTHDASPFIRNPDEKVRFWKDIPLKINMEPENTYTTGKGTSSSDSPFSGCMLIFGGVLHLTWFLSPCKVDVKAANLMIFLIIHPRSPTFFCNCCCLSVTMFSVRTSKIQQKHASSQSFRSSSLSNGIHPTGCCGLDLTNSPTDHSWS